jgi:hypothetical protein
MLIGSRQAMALPNAVTEEGVASVRRYNRAHLRICADEARAVCARRAAVGLGSGITVRLFEMLAYEVLVDGAEPEVDAVDGRYPSPVAGARAIGCAMAACRSRTIPTPCASSGRERRIDPCRRPADCGGGSARSSAMGEGVPPVGEVVRGRGPVLVYHSRIGEGTRPSS